MLNSVRFSAIAILLVALQAQEANATFHLWKIDQVYSNASGTVQYVDLVLPFTFDDESFVAGHPISAGLNSNSFFLPTNLPAVPLANQHFLIATPGFASIAGITPDYTFPVAPFFNLAGDTINWALVDIFSFGSLPNDGIHALDRNGTIVVNSPVNFAGQLGFVPEPASWVLLLSAAVALWWRRRR